MVENIKRTVQALYQKTIMAFKENIAIEAMWTEIGINYKITN